MTGVASDGGQGFPIDFDTTWSGSTMPSPGAGAVFNIRFFGFGSQHDQAVIFALADGSVRRISKVIDSKPHSPAGDAGRWKPHSERVLKGRPPRPQTGVSALSGLVARSVRQFGWQRLLRFAASSA
jgi:hypothetical protein